MRPISTTPRSPNRNGERECNRASARGRSLAELLDAPEKKSRPTMAPIAVAFVLAPPDKVPHGINTRASRSGCVSLIYNPKTTGTLRLTILAKMHKGP
jgi:hypothetical protein